MFCSRKLFSYVENKFLLQSLFEKDIAKLNFKFNCNYICNFRLL